MTAPTPSSRQTPSGAPLHDGFRTHVTFTSNRAIALWEKSVTPPGVEGDNPNELADMFDTTWRRKFPRRLKTLTDFSMTAYYDPAVISGLVTQINKQDTVTVTYPNGATLAFYGVLKSFKPSALEEGKAPECSVDVYATNMDPTTCAEEGLWASLAA